jgi:UDP-3-O-[3-hydroxymyristoyl] N-acetylglucosamine deacetylase
MPSLLVSEQPTALFAVQQSPQQHTLAGEFSLAGIGLHTGITAQVTLRPAAANQGRYFRRQIQGEWVTIPAQVHHVHQTQLATELSHAGVGVQTVEHLLAALMGMGIDNAEIVIDGPEVPLLEGSAQTWSEQILQTGWQSLATPRPQPILTKPVTVNQGNSAVVAIPAPELRFSYGIDFADTPIGQQWCSFTLAEFWPEIAPCRTFTTVQQIEQLRTRGLIKGGSLESALVCDQTTWLNPPLYFDNEPVRHKLLDLLGDLSLLGYLPKAHYLAYRASHALHIALAKAMLAEHAIESLSF